ISFPIPLSAPLDADHVRQVFANGEELVPPETEQTPVNCTGSVADPKAATGYLCVYIGPGTSTGGFSLIPEGIEKASEEVEGADPSGAVIGVAAFEEGMKVRGSWAVTAP
ncbi:MAG TPA: hypothetical protein VFC52_00010, partial [Solirubrobacterales bacterium]|nr:hypothetical protein [Solirubrobacterales bacterium]